jgi:hypothetical protein
VDFYGSRSNSKSKDLLIGEPGTQALLEPPLMTMQAPPREEQEQDKFVQGPVPMRVGNLGEKSGSG